MLHQIRTRLAVTLCLLALAATPALSQAQGPPPAAAPSIKVPADLKVPPGKLISVILESNGKVTKFTCPNPGAEVFREYDPDPSKIRLRFIAYQKGTYYIVATTAIGDVPSEPTVCTIIVGDPPGPPPPPDPGDAFAGTIKAAYAADLAAGRAKPEWAAGVEAVFRQASFDDLKTVGQVQELLAKAIASRALMPAGSMPATAQAVAKILRENLPVDGNTLLNLELRNQCKNLCNRLADAMKGVQP